MARVLTIVLLSAALASAQAPRSRAPSGHDHSEAAGSISGLVRNSAGTPLLGAAVQVLSSASPLAAVVFTDAGGHFSLANLLPGTYQIKVTSARFLPSLRENISVHSGAHQIVNVTLNTLAEAVQLIPARKQAGKDDEDWAWTLRSAANRPVLRVLDDGPVVVSTGDGNAHVSAHVAFLAASGDTAPFSQSGEMTSFRVERSLFSTGTVSVNGNVGYSGNGSMPWTVVRAAYSRRLADGSQPQMAVTVRNFASPSPLLRDAGLQAVALNLQNTTQLMDAIEVSYGSELQSINFMGHAASFRPFGAVDLHLGPSTLVEYRYSSSRPSTRLSKGFDTAPADLSESDPRLTLVGDHPVLERSRHQEVSAARRLGANTTLEVAGYLDHVTNIGLTGLGDFDVADSAFGNVLPDAYASTFTYNGGMLDANGLRVVLQRKLVPDVLTATFDYGYGGVLDFVSGHELVNARSELACRHRSEAVWKFEGRAPGLGTRWQASYRWTSGQAITPVDMFNASPGQADPYFSLFIRQPLPGFFAGRMEAIVDMKNLLAQGYVPVVAGDGHTVYLVQTARAIRGGLAFTF
ncbi:MAG: carboxypeptidase regulatory-like domain-containing protein [Acidobacteria bacterium]|nr:carboxypeptidase regulatory-like domain-containing protein [Acidobacteriota bacterium]